LAIEAPAVFGLRIEETAMALDSELKISGPFKVD
jgi:hypothetical protein